MKAQELEHKAKQIRNEIQDLLRELKTEIFDEYRAPGCEDETRLGMMVTVGISQDALEWAFQTGDNSYTGGAYAHPFWGVAVLYRRSNIRKLSQEITDQAFDNLVDYLAMRGELTD